MNYNPDFHHRRSIRLHGYDYSQAGAYFITMCSYQKQPFFGTIRQNAILLSDIGEMVAEEWLNSAIVRPEIALDGWVIMPNHMHCIVVLHSLVTEEREHHLEPEHKGIVRREAHSLATCIGGFKGAVTRRVNTISSTQQAVWQRNYYERVIRNERELNAYRTYIVLNPQRWNHDEHYV